MVAAEPETWQLLRRETARLNRLGEDIAHVSRAEEHQLELRVVRLSPQLLLDTAAHAAAPGFIAKGVALELAPEANAPDVDADPDRIGEVLANLLENALRHTPPGGTVTLSARPDGHDALLTVADTGDGVDPGDLERIFERFYRTDVSGSRVLGGSGIGLTISRALVEAHGGQLWAESDGTGTGTRFLCRLRAA